MRKLINSLLICGAFFFFISCNPTKKESRIQAGQVMFPFDLSDVTLTESAFRHAMNMDEQWILALNPDKLMAGFRMEAGLEPKASKYGGWEGGPLSGQTFGHYLSACAMMYAATGNQELLNRMNYAIAELDTCQQMHGNGMLASFPGASSLFEEITRGDIKTKGFDINGRAVPLYIMHKLFAGLTDVYTYTRNEEALEVLIKLSDWFTEIFEPLTDEQIQLILDAEHGGINESLANVYALTGNKKYLDLSERLNHQFVLAPLANGEDKLTGLHANTQIPKVVGVIREYELTGNPAYLNTANYFWEHVIHHHSYVIGGNSEAEHFGMPGRACDRLTDKTCETCNTYNMLKLTRHLYQLTGSTEKADYYERALYNHILASQNPADGMICYMSPLSSGEKNIFPIRLILSGVA